jgi:hypothetical protein
MTGPLFIVGNSRSGTTMMMRIMDRHPLVHSINEPHFFETMWSPSDHGKEISTADAKTLFAKLFTRQRAGFFESVDQHAPLYKKEIETLLDSWPAQLPLTRINVYGMFLEHEPKVAKKEIACEKTPQNIFYINEILEAFPNARILHMVRDPRATMLSQKNKWKRRELGATFLTEKEILRLRMNYHPITMSKLWNAAIDAGHRFAGHPAMLEVRFEDLIQEPHKQVKAICTHFGLEFHESMLEIAQAGSSLEADKSDEKGIRHKPIRSWQDKGLREVEIWHCQRICKENMRTFHFEPVETKPNPLSIAWSYLSFPVKLIGALMLNLSRMRSIIDTLKRRMS